MMLFWSFKNAKVGLGGARPKPNGYVRVKDRFQSTPPTHDGGLVPRCKRPTSSALPKGGPGLLLQGRPACPNVFPDPDPDCRSARLVKTTVKG